MRPTFRQLEAFVALCELGSFSSAAKRIHSSNSATSALIKELESLLSAQLFERTTRRVRLTQAGESMLESASRALREVERLTSQVEAVQARRIGRVSVAAPPLLAAQLLVPAAQLLRAKHPGIETRIFDVPSVQIASLLRTSQVEIGFGVPRLLEHDLQAQPVFSGPLYVLLPRKHALNGRGKKSLRLSDLVDYPLVLQLPGNPFRVEIEELFTRHQLALKVAAEVTQLGTVMSMVEAGFGIAILPCFAPLVSDAADVVIRPLESLLATSEISMLHDASRTLSPAAQAFYEAIRQVVASK